MPELAYTLANIAVPPEICPEPTDKLPPVMLPVAVKDVTVNGTNIVALDVTFKLAVVKLLVAVILFAAKSPLIVTLPMFARSVGKST